MGGTEDEPQVYVYDSQYGLIMLDLMDGIEVWNLMENTCPLGDAAVYTVDTETGNPVYRRNGRPRSGCHFN